MGEIYSVIPEKWVQNGYTLAYLKDLPLFVHGALPGETAAVEIVKSVKGHSFGICTDVITQNPQRQHADCESFPECGGCSYRHIAYNEEISLKRKLLTEQQYVEKCFETAPARYFHMDRNEYRNHIQIHHDKTGTGFYKLHSNSIVPLPESGCRNLSEKLNHAIKTFSFPGEGTFRFREVCGEIYNPDRLEKNKSLTECMFHNSQKEFMWEFPSDGFFQQNRFLMDQWLQTIAGGVPEGRPDTLELFCGSGLIGGYIRNALGRYSGYETHGRSLNFARKNFKRLNLEGNFKNVDLYRTVPDLSSYKLIIANPPRAGLKNKILHELKEWKGNLIYSSCNPHTMNRDLKYLLDFGYSCTESSIFDFFPGTPHLEVVMSLVR